jgi:hypothetical protein
VPDPLISRDYYRGAKGNMMLTEAQKRELYQAGRYVMQVPPVYSCNWTDLDWIRWIDTHGRWGEFGTPNHGGLQTQPKRAA